MKSGRKNGNRPGDPARLVALDSYGLLDTPPERDFDDLVGLASEICEVPMSLIGLIDARRQWYKSQVGLDVSEIPLPDTFCRRTLEVDGPLTVEDATRDIRFQENKYVTGAPFIRFYSGIPIVNEEGFTLGTFCVMDTRPRVLTPFQQKSLTILARHALREMELRRKVQELRDREAVHRKMLALISHDMRAPLNSLFGLLQMWEKNIVSVQELKELLPRVNERFRSVQELFQNVLAWGLAQFDGADRQSGAVNLAELIHRVLNALRPQAEAKGIQLLVELETPFVWADSNMLEVVLRNMVSNAIKFTEKGTITCGARQQGHRVHISVADTGVGMAADMAQRLFSWEHRKSTPGTAGEAGSGFGLQLCHEFVEKMGGQLSLSSKPGEGTTATVNLPVANPEAGEEP